jgi:hypothetical protein
MDLGEVVQSRCLARDVADAPVQVQRRTGLLQCGGIVLRVPMHEPKLAQCFDHDFRRRRGRFARRDRIA